MELPSAMTTLGKRSGGPKFMAYGDAIRVVGTVAVVVGHVADMPLFSAPPLGHQWWVANIVDAFTRWAVPAYIMLSGALLLDPARLEPAGVYYRKRLTRIGIPLVFWSAFFMLFSVYYTKWVTPRQAWINLLMGEPYAHLHFIFRIAGLYALTPMVRVFLRQCTRRMLGATVIILLCIWSADSLVCGFTETKLSAFARFAPFMGYYLAGYWLRDVKLSRGQVWGCALITLLCVAILAVGTGWLVERFGMKGFPSMGMLLYDFLSPVRVVMAITGWLFLTQVFAFKPAVGGPGPVRHFITWAAPTTLGLYLIHPAFREILHVHGYTSTWPNIYAGIPLISLAVYVPSLLLAWVLMKIPYLRRIVN